MGKTLSNKAVAQIRATRADVRQLMSLIPRSIQAGLPPLLPSNPGKAYSGPFAVVAKDAATVTILGNNADKGRAWSNQVTLGTAVKTVSEMDFSMGSSGYIYLKITYSSDYIVEISSAESMPDQTNAEYYIPLAYVSVASGSISSITQLQYGPIQGSGRIF